MNRNRIKYREVQHPIYISGGERIIKKIRNFENVRMPTGAFGSEIPIIGSLNESGEIREGIPLIVRLFYEKRGKFPREIFYRGDCEEYNHLDYVQYQIESCRERGYGFVYELDGGVDNEGIVIPKRVLRFNEFPRKSLW